MNRYGTGSPTLTTCQSNALCHIVKPALQGCWHSIGMKAALCCIAQYEVVAHAIVTADDDETFIVGSIEHIVGTGLCDTRIVGSLSHSSMGCPHSLALQRSSFML